MVWSFFYGSPNSLINHAESSHKGPLKPVQPKPCTPNPKPSKPCTYKPLYGSITCSAAGMQIFTFDARQ